MTPTVGIPDGTRRRPFRVPHELNDAAACDRRRAADPEPWLVVLFGALDYYVLSEHEKEGAAETALRVWEGRARRKPAGRGVAVLPVDHECLAHFFQVRRQSDLDELVRAIQASYHA